MVKYRYLNTFAQVEECCAQILHKVPPRIALDIESSSNTQYPELISLALPMSIESPENYNVMETVETSIVVYLLHISHSRFIPKSLSDLLQSQHIVKIGCDLGGDGHVLETSLGCQLRPTVDIQILQLSMGSCDYSLDRLGKRYLGMGKIAFSHRNADWSGALTGRQLEYAVMDAYLTLGVYEAMLSGQTCPEVPSTEDAPNQDHSLLDFLTYSTVFAGKRPPKLSTVINAIVNNYTPWRKMHPSESKPLAEEGINALVNEGVFQISGSNCLLWSNVQYKLPEREPDTQLQSIFDHIQKVHQSPMKYMSLVRAISNKFWTYTPVYAREQRTENALKQMTNDGWLSLNGNCVIW